MTEALLEVIREVGGRYRRLVVRPAARLPSPPRACVRVGSPILGESVFKDALVRERKRADRFGAPFAVLLMDRTDHAFAAPPWASILRAMAAVKRDVDALGWLDQGTVLGLILPDVSSNGALRVMQGFQREIGRRFGGSALASLSVHLYGHGVEVGPDGAAFPPVDVLIEALSPRRVQPERDPVKRGFDIFGSLMLLALFAPVSLGVFAVVKWTSPGPVLLRQVRVGRRGEPFEMFKFRTMYQNAGHGIHEDYMTRFITSSKQQSRTGDEVFKLTNDPRITPAGRFLRKTSVDELPQLWNVLRGDMSLVGPRPPLPFEVERYQPWHRRRVLEVKPGLTGLWQVNGRSRTTFDEMVRLDLRYARTHTLWTDIKILAATPRAMVRGAC